MRNSLLLLALCGAIAVPLSSQSLPTARPEEVGMSSQRLELIGQVLRSEIDEGRIPGPVVAVVRRGRLV